MYTQSPPPNAQQSQQSQQRLASNSSQPQQPLTPRLAASTQQNFPGWRHDSNARPPPHMAPGVPPNVRPPFAPGQRPPPNIGAPGFLRPPAPGIMC